MSNKNTHEINIPKKIIQKKKNIEKLQNENIEKLQNENIEIVNIEGFEYLKSIKDNTIDLILTDPPYIISKETGMDTHYNTVKNN